MAGDPGSTSGERPKNPVDQWFELFVYAPLGFALDARQLLPRFIDRGRSQVVLARVVGRYAVQKGSNRAGGYLGQSQEQVTALLQAFGLVPEEAAGPAADPADLRDFEADDITFGTPPAEPEPDPEPGREAESEAVPEVEPDREPVEVPEVTSLAIPDYDNLSASQVVPRLGGLSQPELDAVRRYEAAQRGRKTILNKIAQLEIGVNEGARRAGVEDLDDLERLARVAIDQQRALRGGVLWSLTLGRQEPVAESLSRALTDPAQRVVVGTIDEAVIGYAAVKLVGLADGRPLGVVDELYVEPQGRGVGVGEAMMDLLVEWCRQHDCVGIDAVALPGDRDTKNFFETFGLKARALVVHRSLTDDPAPDPGRDPESGAAS